MAANGSLPAISQYTVHVGTAPGNYTQTINLGNVTAYTVDGLLEGKTYYFATRARDANGNTSGYSNEVSKYLPAIVNYTVTSSASSGGTISPTGTTSLLAGTSKTYYISPDVGYNIANVAVDGISVGSVGSYTFNNIASNHTIAASFSIQTFAINASAGTGGVIAPAGISTGAYGSSKTFTITPNLGYSISNVLVDGVSVGAVSSYTFNGLNTNHTISASFIVKPVNYTVTASAGVGGSISPAGAVSVQSGSSKIFTITPSTGYAVSNVTVNGVSVGAVSSYTFSNITGNQTISAAFVRSPTGVVMTAINCGGSSFRDSYGIQYLTDSYTSGGGAMTNYVPIASTVDDVIYQTYRYGYLFGYKIPIANGNYIVKLRFAEPTATAVGQRVFNVDAQGVNVLSKLDIFALAGRNNALVIAFPVTVANGLLHVSFSGIVDRAMVNAVVVTR